MKYITFVIILSVVSALSANSNTLSTPKSAQDIRILAQQYYKEIQDIKRAKYLADERISLAQKIAECEKYGIDCRINGVNIITIKKPKHKSIKQSTRVAYLLPMVIAIINDSVDLTTQVGVKRHKKIGDIVTGYKIIEIKATYIIVRDIYTEELHQIDFIWSNTITN